MRRHRAPWKSGRRWLHALLFGLPHGLLLFSLFAFTLTHPGQFSPNQAILLGYLFTFLIPLFAGYSYCYQRRHEGWQSGWAGLRVGLVAYVSFSLAASGWLFVSLIIADNSPPPAPSATNPRDFYSPSLALIIDLIVLVYLAILSVFGLFISAASGRVGGALAILLAKRLQQSHEQDM